MCSEAKTNRESLVSSDLNTIDQLFDELWHASGIVQCNLGIFDSFRLLSIKNGRGLPIALCGVTCIWFDLVMRQLLLQERNMSLFG